MSKSPTNQIVQRLENLRADEPVLWAITRGATTELRIGLMTGLGPKSVAEALANLQEQGHIKHYMGKAWLISKQGKQYKALAEAAKLSDLIEARWIAEVSPKVLSEIKGVLSSGNQTVIASQVKAEKATRQMALTDKQQQAWNLISGWLEDQGRKGGPFTTREAAKAQGYDKAGFTKSQLLALATKGRVKALGGRPEKWILTEKPTLSLFKQVRPKRPRGRSDTQADKLKPAL
jgi:hypothetical protein